MLDAGYARLAGLASVRKPRVRNVELSAWVQQRPQTQVGKNLKALLLQNLSLVKTAARRTEEGVVGLQGLHLGFRDFELFEWSCCEAICDAIGVERDPTKLAQARLVGTQHDLIPVNVFGGQAAMATILQGWRDQSVLPSAYLPDFILHFNRQTPILIDAKFRVGRTLAEPCSKDGFKEVQAYLDEFGLIGAIILVPSIPSSLAAGQPNALSVLITGNQKGSGRRVWIIEYAPELGGFDEALLAAAQDIAAAELVAIP
jgi:hypothetical protein